MRRIPIRSDTDATRVADCFILDFPCLCEASGQPMTLVGARRRLRETSIGTPLAAAVNPGPPGCVSAASGARIWLRARTTASPITRMGTLGGGWLARNLAERHDAHQRNALVCRRLDGSCEQLLDPREHPREVSRVL